MLERPVAAPRRKPPGTSSSALITVIRTLTTSQSAEQRQLQKSILEKDFKESQAKIDALVEDHQHDVEECLVTFRGVSKQISACRERIFNVRNALSTCRSLLQSRREDLRKLWIEDSQQRHVCAIMQQLEQLRDVKHRVDLLLEKREFHEAAKLIAQSRDLIDSRLSAIGGLSQLRQQLVEAADGLRKQIEAQLAEIIVQEPFEMHMLDIIRSLPENRIGESELALKLAKKTVQPRALTGTILAPRIKANLSALSELDGAQGALERLLALSATQLSKQVSMSVGLMRLKASHDDGADKTHLAALIQMVVCQLESSRAAHTVLAECAAKVPAIGPDAARKVLPAFWFAAQSSVESLVSDHLDVSSGGSSLTSEARAAVVGSQLFRFDAAACSSGTSFATPSTQAVQTVCPPSAYNIVPMFPWLRRLTEAVETATSVQMCQLHRFVHSFVMELFIERVKSDFDARLTEALKLDDVRASVNADAVRPEILSSQNLQQLLGSAERVRALSAEIHELLIQMDDYAHRFTAIWVLVLTEYSKHISALYEKKVALSSQTTAPSPSGADGPVRRKISAAWAADEDISRLLMSLPNWILANSASQVTSPSSAPLTPANLESEKEVRDRNERESDILIGNLGTQKKIERSELLSDWSDVRTLAALHESLRWLCCEGRALVNTLPAKVRNSLRERKVQLKSSDGKILNDVPVLHALEDCFARLESVSATCLLMLHLELRVHCFFHLLPLTRVGRPAHHDDADQEVVELGRDLQTFHSLLQQFLSAPKMKYIFDGLGHLCAAIFIHTSQQIQRLTDAGRKRVSRNIWGVQQRLAQLTSRREAELDRARAFYELLSYEPDELLSILPERRAQFSHIELNHLVTLSVRSHPTLSSQRGALDERLSQLRSMLQK